MSFNQEVWSLIKQIPKGKVTTYKLVAEKLGTKAYRAVGNACNKNPFSPESPCHRVIRSDSRIGGYASGAKNKIALLKQEGIRIKNGRAQDLEKILYRFLLDREKNLENINT